MRTSSIPDAYSLAVHTLAKVWNPECEYSGEPSSIKDPRFKELHTHLDRAARDFLNQSKLPNLPTLEELKAARDQGPEALAALLAAKTPDQMAEIGIGAVLAKSLFFLQALLKHGANPTTGDSAGRTMLDTAAQVHGMNSDIYKLIKDSVKKP